MKFDMNHLNISEKGEKKISWLRSLSALLGGLFITYFGIVLISKFIFTVPEEALIISLMLNTFAWPCLSLWIFMSSSTKVAFLRAVIPSIIIGITFLFIVL